MIPQLTERNRALGDASFNATALLPAARMFARVPAFVRTGPFGFLMRFGAVGATSTLLYLGLAMSIKSFASTTALVASVLAYCLAGIFSYSAHRGFTFSSSQSHGEGLPRFLVTTVLGLSLSSALPYVIHDVLALPAICAFGVVCILIPVINLVLLCFWVFPAATTRAANATSKSPIPANR